LKNTFFIIFIFFIFSFSGKSQSYAPAAGFSGSTAIQKDSSIFIDWAKDAEIIRGYQNITFPENGFVDYGTFENATGKADGNPNVISLGDGGIAILTFNSPITNGEGFDFAVFENGFFENNNSELAFLELAFVEVSTDGIEYIRFPAVSEVQTETQTGSFENINAGYIHNLAGKYTMLYGTPFDLKELTGLVQGTSVNLNKINYIRIIDVTGTIDEEFASYDSKGNKVNDPYPTAFASGGFDLDAVGIINNEQNTKSDNELIISPNPINDFLNFKTNISEVERVEIFSITGELLISTNKTFNIDVTGLEKGVYILRIFGDEKSYSGLFLK